MTSEHAAPPLPQPQPAPAAARTLNQAAQAAASAWAQPMDPAGQHRALRHLCSTLRDLGIAIRGLARSRPHPRCGHIPPGRYPSRGRHRIQRRGMAPRPHGGPHPRPGALPWCRRKPMLVDRCWRWGNGVC